MPPANYKVSEPEAVTNEFRAIISRARAEGRIALVRRAARYLMDELACDPVGFGESRDYLATMDLDTRVGFARPLYVEYAIHEPSRQVFIRRVRLLD